MIDIEELVYSDPRLKELSIKEMEEYERNMKSDIAELTRDGDVSDEDIRLVAKSLIDIFFLALKEYRKENPNE